MEETKIKGFALFSEEEPDKILADPGTTQMFIFADPKSAAACHNILARNAGIKTLIRRVEDISYGKAAVSAPDLASDGWQEDQ